MKSSSSRRSHLFRLVALAPLVAVAGCLTFPAPDPPTPPLTKAEASAVAKCQQTIKKARRAFVKVELAALDACVDGVLAVRLPFENSLIDQAAFDAGVAKMQGKCAKGYAKITAASTKFVDAVVKHCTPVQAEVLGPYDGLRFQAAYGTSIGTSSIETLAGAICGNSAYTVTFQLWQAVPRVNELLRYLGPSFLSEGASDDTQFGVPNILLDPRCSPLLAGQTISGFCTLLPTPTPTSTPTPQPTSTS